MSVSANVYGHQAQPSSSTARRDETDFPDNSNFLITPAPRGFAREVPRSGRIVRCTPASAPFGSPSARGYPRRGGVGACLARPNGGFGDSHRRRLSVLRVSPTIALGTPNPARRARCDECASLVPKVALRALRGGSPFKVVAQPLFLCFAPLADFPRTGRNVGGEAAQNRARQFRVKQVYSESAALGFPPLAGVAPLSIERDKTAHG